MNRFTFRTGAALASAVAVASLAAWPMSRDTFWPILAWALASSLGVMVFGIVVRRGAHARRARYLADEHEHREDHAGLDGKCEVRQDRQ